MNIRIVSKLPIETHKYIVEKISDCSHIKHKLYSRYIKFLKSVNDSSKPGLKFLLNIAKNDIRSVTSANLRKIFDDSKLYIVPGVTTKQSLKDYEAYRIPDGQEWRIPLLSSLMKVREGQWEIIFDEEDSDDPNENNIDHLINMVCTE